MDPMFKELDFLRKSEGMLRTQRCAPPIVRELRTDLSHDIAATSWFHLDHTNRMYKKFRNLDAYVPPTFFATMPSCAYHRLA